MVGECGSCWAGRPGGISKSSDKIDKIDQEISRDFVIEYGTGPPQLEHLLYHCSEKVSNRGCQRVFFVKHSPASVALRTSRRSIRPDTQTLLRT